eukprot:scaffold9479_cov109-Isochrysis_galbana.AAC.4
MPSSRPSDSRTETPLSDSLQVAAPLRPRCKVVGWRCARHEPLATLRNPVPTKTGWSLLGRSATLAGRRLFRGARLSSQVTAGASHAWNISRTDGPVFLPRAEFVSFHSKKLCERPAQRPCRRNVASVRRLVANSSAGASLCNPELRPKLKCSGANCAR